MTARASRHTFMRASHVSSSSGADGEAEAGHEVVGDDDVAQRVELVDAAFLRDVRDASCPSHCLFSGANVSLMT